MGGNLFLKYRGIDETNNSEIELAALGESITGFDSVIKDIFKIAKIEADLKIGINSTREGSLIVDLVVHVIYRGNNFPFANIQDLLNFLRISNKEIFQTANAFFGATDAIRGIHRTLNDYFARNPLDQQILSDLVPIFITYILLKAKTQKQNPDFDELPKNYAIETHKIIKKGKFKKALKPFIDNEVSTIEVSADPKFINKTIVTSENFENYLSEDEKILPEYENEKTYIFTGTIVAMQCSHGDSMTIQIHGFSRANRNLIAYPPDGKNTKDFDQFYQNSVVIKALVRRHSLYQKPKLYIQEISLQQQPLF